MDIFPEPPQGQRPPAFRRRDASAQIGDADPAALGGFGKKVGQPAPGRHSTASTKAEGSDFVLSGERVFMQARIVQKSGGRREFFMGSGIFRNQLSAFDIC